MNMLTLSAETMRRRRGIKWHRYPEDVLPAWVADMDFPVAPAVQQAIRQVVDQMDYGYPHRDPEHALEATFARRMADRFGWAVEAERVQPLADLVQGIAACIVAFSQPGDGVVVQTPIYPPFLAAIELTGRRRVVNPLVDDGRRFVVDAEGLARTVDAGTRLLLLCNPHNPTGRVLEREELEAVGRVAADRDLVVVSDEIHCDLVYPGRRHVPFASLDPELAARTVTLNSATKGFNIAGLRCGVAYFGSKDLQERFRRALPPPLLGHVNSIGHDATVAAWEHGQPWLDEVMEQLRWNRDRVASWAAAQGGVRHHPPEATYLAWLDLRALALPATAHSFCLEEARVGLNPGEDFGPGGEGCVRLNFATSPDILDRILERLSAALERLRRGDRKVAASRGR